MILTNTDSMKFRVTHLNKRLKTHVKSLEALASHKQAPKLSFLDSVKQKVKEQTSKQQPNVYVLDFKGDLRASAVSMLREEVTLILKTAKAGRDSVMIRLESPGGLVTGYGLASAQLQRIKEAGLHLTVCVDEVAASGGYMMACTADKIVGAPFAVFGSIGVVAQLPNFHEALKRLHVDFNVYTAGKHKRTLTVFGENSKEGEAKFIAELEQTHELFKSLVATHRPKLDLEKVATGEHWYGKDAIELNLLDQIKTSDDWILEAMSHSQVYLVGLTRQKSPVEKWLGKSASAALSRLETKLFAPVNLNSH